MARNAPKNAAAIIEAIILMAFTTDMPLANIIQY